MSVELEDGGSPASSARVASVASENKSSEDRRNRRDEDRIEPRSRPTRRRSAGCPSGCRRRWASVFFKAPGGRGWPLIQLIREPAWVPEGSSRWQKDEWAARAHTNQLHITVEVQGTAATATQLEREAERISSSVTPMQ